MQNDRDGLRRPSALLRWAGVAAVAGLVSTVLAVRCGPILPSAHDVAIGSASVGEGAGGRAHRPGAHPHTTKPAMGPSGPAVLSGVVGGTMFGGDVPLAQVQNRLGRRLAIVRDYYRIGQSFPERADRQAMAAGATLLVSLDSVPGKGPTYASIVAGQHDGAIRAFLSQVEQAAVTYRLSAIYIAFEHEADSPQHAVLGPPAEFIQAWDHVHQLAAAAHLDWNTGGRLHWVWILTAFGFRSTKGARGTPRAGAGQYWPGSGEADIVAADGYNSADCNVTQAGTNMVATGTEITSPAVLFGPVVNFAQAHGGLPVFIPEWGTVPYVSPSVEPGYINMMRAYVLAHPQIAAVLYWDAHAQGNGCDYVLNNHPASLAALAAMGQSPGLQGRVPAA